MFGKEPNAICLKAEERHFKACLFFGGRRGEGDATCVKKKTSRTNLF